MVSQTIAFVGNPNSGKTSLFNALTGLNQHVGNFSGVTVEKKSAEIFLTDNQKTTIIDLPGTQTLYPTSEDERVTCNALWDRKHVDFPDKVVVIADATQLRRSLLLCTQVIDLGIPAILALNMIDLLDEKKTRLDIDFLSKELGIPVVKVSALKKEGLTAFKKCLAEPVKASRKKFLTIPAGFTSQLEPIMKTLDTQQEYLGFQAMLIPKEFALDDNIDTPIEPEPLIANEILVRYDRINAILTQVWKEPVSWDKQLTHKLDKILIHKVWGYVIFIGVLMLIFQALFAWASYPMDWIDAGFTWTVSQLQALLPDVWWASLLTDGLIAGIGGVIIFIPQIAFLFFFISLLEESGYMSRVVFLMDRIMRPFGFSGRAVIPLIGGMACAIPSIMMTRNISERKERLITIMVTPLMSCSARIPVYVLLIAMFVPAAANFGPFNLQGLIMMGLYVLGFIMALVFAFIFKLILRYNSTGIFISELPKYRMPRWNNVGITMYQKSRLFVVEAGKIILIISVVLWFLASYGPGDELAKIDASYALQIENSGLTAEAIQVLESQKGADKLEASYAGHLGHIIEPVIRPLGFDWKIGIALVTSFAAREVFVGTMATIYRVGEGEGQTESLLSLMKKEINPRTGKPVYSTATVLALLIFYAFAMQCMSTLAVTQKETGSWKWTFVMLGYLTGLAYFASFLTYQGLS